jgi:pimeloyl-ACP methyl ester carboxylesterase
LISAGAKCGKLRAENGAARQDLAAKCGADAQCCDDIDVVELLPKVQLPTLVLHCRHDNAPFEQGRRIARSIPRAKFGRLASDTQVVLAGEPAWPRLTSEIAVFPAE